MKGHAYKRLDCIAWEIAVYDKTKCYTFEIKEHDASKESARIKTTMVDFDSEELEALKGLVLALQEMGLYPNDATATELKATKFHLEDMRKLVFKNG